MSDFQQLTHVRERIEKIRANADDDYEAAHACEDAIHCDVLTVIANQNLTAEQMAELAAAALDTRNIDFPRWFG